MVKTKLRNDYLVSRSAQTVVKMYTNSSKHEIRKLFKESLGIDEEDGAAFMDSAAPEDVQAFENGNGPGPNPQMLRLNMHDGPKSLWNKQAFLILFEELKHQLTEDWNMDPLSDDENNTNRELLTMIENQFKRIRFRWKEMQPQALPTGACESPEEVKARINEKTERKLKLGRETERCLNVSVIHLSLWNVLTSPQKFKCRTRTLEGMVTLKRAEGAEDVEAWEWLYEVIT